MLHTIPKGADLSVTVQSKEKYSGEKIAVEKGQEYEFTCDPKQRWTDWFIKSSPDGFFNLPAWIFGLRVKGVKCFCLCGTYNDSDEMAFAIGSGKIIRVIQNGTFSFFANDSANHYSNNKGSVVLKVARVK